MQYIFIKELCELMGIWNLRTSPYLAQTNRQVEWAQQTLMPIIGKLSKEQKVEWIMHLPELVHAYNYMRLAITGYSPHYLKFGCWPPLPINFYFPMIRSMENTSILITMLLRYVNNCKMPSRKHKCSPHQRLRDRSNTMIERLMLFHWSRWPGLG